LHKETLKLEHHEIKPEPKADPPTRQQFDDFNKTKRVETDMRARKNYSEAPVVQQTMSSFKSSTGMAFSPSVTHRTSTMSNWRNIVAMDTPS